MIYVCSEYFAVDIMRISGMWLDLSLGFQTCAAPADHESALFSADLRAELVSRSEVKALIDYLVAQSPMDMVYPPV